MSTNGASSPATKTADGPLAVLQRIRRALPPRAVVGERCEMCTAEIPESHSHLVDLEHRSLACVCRPCYLLFAPEGAGAGRFRAVPERYLRIVDFRMAPAEWDRLQIPVGVAFFFHNSIVGETAAFYPSPAGATESLLPLDAWETVAGANPVVRTMAPDVEALLVRSDRSGTECFVVPIDACYELVGLLRKNWKGFDGGQDAHEQLDGFFARLAGRARDVGADGE